MLTLFRNLFQKKKPPEITKEYIAESFQKGDLVVLTYKDPRKLGFSSDTNLTLTRFNHNELDNRVIKGTITANFYKNKPLDEQILEVATIKPDGTPRYFLLMSSEIEEIKKV